MTIDLVIKYEALSKKGTVKGLEILTFPIYKQVCFSHASQLAQAGVFIRTSIVEKRDYDIGYCYRCIDKDFEPFVTSLGNDYTEYEHEETK